MISIEFGETVKHLAWSQEATDEDGHRTSGWAAPAPVAGVGVDIITGQEPRTPDGAETSRADLRIYLPPGFTCGHRDRFIIRGKTYEVEGIAEPLPNFFTGITFRTEVTVRRVDE